MRSAVQLPAASQKAPRSRPKEPPLCALFVWMDTFFCPQVPLVLSGAKHNQNTVFKLCFWLSSAFCLHGNKANDRSSDSGQKSVFLSSAFSFSNNKHPRPHWVWVSGLRIHLSNKNIMKNLTKFYSLTNVLVFSEQSLHFTGMRSLHETWCSCIYSWMFTEVFDWLKSINSVSMVTLFIFLTHCC